MCGRGSPLPGITPRCPSVTGKLSNVFPFAIHLINFEDFVDAIIDGRDLEILQFASEAWVRYRYQELFGADI